jgi:hypothetical protein
MLNDSFGIFNLLEKSGRNLTHPSRKPKYKHISRLNGLEVKKD